MQRCAATPVHHMLSMLPLGLCLLLGGRRLADAKHVAARCRAGKYCVLCSREKGAHWVDRESEAFLSLGKHCALCCYLTHFCCWGLQARRRLWTRATCLWPPALPSMPAHATRSCCCRARTCAARSHPAAPPPRTRCALRCAREGGFRGSGHSIVLLPGEDLRTALAPSSVAAAANSLRFEARLRTCLGVPAHVPVYFGAAAGADRVVARAHQDQECMLSNDSY